VDNLVGWVAVVAQYAAAPPFGVLELVHSALVALLGFCEFGHDESLPRGEVGFDLPMWLWVRSSPSWVYWV